VAPGRGDQTWFATHGRYQLELWAPGGKDPIATIVREAGWFPPYTPQAQSYGEDGIPLPGMMGIREDSAGRVWVAIGRAAPAWIQSRGQERRDCARTRSCPPLEGSELERAFEGRVEIIDRKTSRLLTTAAFPSPVVFVQSDADGSVLLASGREDKDGYLQCDIWVARLLVR
jgi:hypothetical protein